MKLPGTASHEQRLDRAAEITRRVLSAHGENVLAVGVYGSTGRGTDGPYSDLEMAVVLREAQGFYRHEFYLEGLKAEVEFYTPDLLRMEQAQVDIAWPFRGGQFANVLATHDPEGWWALAAVFVPSDASFRAALQGAVIGDYVEHVAKYLNARHTGDGGQQRWTALQVARDALGLAGLFNRRWYPARATAFTDSLTFELLPTGHAAFLRLVDEGDLRDLNALADRLLAYHEGVLSLAGSCGIRLQGTTLPDFRKLPVPART